MPVFKDMHYHAITFIFEFLPKAITVGFSVLLLLFTAAVIEGDRREDWPDLIQKTCVEESVVITGDELECKLWDK